MRPFDHIVTIDWSARSTPALGTDSIWVCWLDASTDDHDLTNHATRLGARDSLVARLGADRARTLVAIDVALGFPSGFAAAAGLVTADDDATPWRATWAHLAEAVVDAHDNRSEVGRDRFTAAAALNARLGEPHFWGAPAARAQMHLGTTKPAALTAALGSRKRSGTVRLAEFRRTEERLRSAGLRPFSVWQLLGAGAVGGQSLTALPVLDHLRRHPLLRDRLRVWPFETGVAEAPRSDIVVAEAWPSALPAALVDSVEHPVRDARQVIALARHLADLQRRGALGAQFTPQLDDEERRAVVDEEGWVLGVG